MTSHAALAVLIVGAGPAGLVLALTLRQNGVQVRIIDKETQFRPGQRGTGLQPRTLEVFNFLGVLPDFQAIGLRQVPRRSYKLPGGTEPLMTTYMAPPQEPTPATPLPNGLHLGQDHTEEILRKHLGKYDSHVELGTELDSFEQHPDHVVAHLIKKPEGGEEEQETIVCRWLVGTDGARGVVRKQLGLRLVGETREEQHIVVGEVEVGGLDRNHWHCWGDASTKLLMLRPTENPGTFYMLAGGQIDHKKVVADRGELVKFIYDATDRRDLRIGQVPWISEFRPNIRMVDKFGNGRVFVAGDAAHIHSPTGGQGLNSSVQDSFNLGWKLASVAKGRSSPALLDTYTEERLPVIASMLEKTTELLDRMNAAKHDRPADVDAAWRRGGALTQLGVHYRWSSIVRDERTPPPKQPQDTYGGAAGEGLRAGDRAPDAPVLKIVSLRALDVIGGSYAAGDVTSVFRIIRPTYHIVFIFTKDADWAQSAVNALHEVPPEAVRPVVVLPKDVSTHSDVTGVDIVVVDAEGHAYAGYGASAEQPLIVTIRPDGVVGAIVFEVDGLRKYFSKVFAV